MARRHHDLPQGHVDGDLRGAPAERRGFDLEGEITARVLASGRRVYEVPITYHARGREEGKKLTAVDALRVIVMLVRRRLGR